jgi:hypothetical protein
MTVDSARPWPKLSPVQRFGPLLAVVALLVGAGTIATVKGKRTEARSAVSSGPDGADTGGVKGDRYEDATNLAPMYSEAKKAGTVDDYDWGPRCDTERGRIMLPTVYAPPCVPKWGGSKPWKDRSGKVHPDNGGATSKGVTADEIVIAYYIPGPQDLLTTAEALGVYDGTELRIKAMNELIKAAQDSYETYGRKIVIKPYRAAGDGVSGAAARADARKVAEDLDAFASIGGPTQSIAYQDELARRGVLCIACGAAAPESVYQKTAPYSWGVYASPDQVAQGVLDFGVANLFDKPAQFAGDPSMRGKKRVTGIVHYEQDPPLYGELDRRLTERYRKLGVEAKVTITYLLDQATLPRQAQGIISRLKEQGVTSVVFLGDPLMLIQLTQAATKQDYFPEWQITGTVLTDATTTGRLYDQRQWAHAFGASTSPARSRPELGEAWRLYKWYFGKDPEARKSLPVLAPPVQLLFTGIHLAGPDLTARTFAGGLFRYPPSGGGPTAPRISYGHHGQFETTDYVAVDDFTLVWWDPEMMGPNEQGTDGKGMWRYPAGGARFLLGDVRKVDDDLLFKDTPSAPGILDDLPPSDKTGDYPPPPGAPAASGGG